MRAIAGKPDLEVSFAADRPMLSGHKARLPEPPRKLTRRDVAITRGLGDSIALRLACHDPSVHRAHLPEGKNARAVFDAVEQARVEALGARRMAGVARNLAAMLEDRYHRGNYHEVTDRADAPLEDAVALMVRERLTGDAAAGLEPQGRRALARLDRGARRRRPRAARRDRSRTSAASPAPCASSSPRSTWRDELGSEGGEEEDEGEEPARARTSRGRVRRRARAPTPRAPRTSRPPPTRARPAKARSSEADADELIDDADMSDARDTGEARRADAPFSNLPPVIDYQAFTTRFDEIVQGGGPLRRRRARPAALLSRQAARPSPGRRRPARQPAAAAADGAAEPRAGISTSRKACSTPRGCRASSSTRCSRSPSRPSATPSSATRWSRCCSTIPARCAAGRSRSPRPAPTSSPARSSAAASRSRSSASPPAPGRAASRARPGCRPASRPIPAASTTSATSSTRPPTRPGGARAAISA